MEFSLSHGTIRRMARRTGHELVCKSESSIHVGSKLTLADGDAGSLPVPEVRQTQKAAGFPEEPARRSVSDRQQCGWQGPRVLAFPRSTGNEDGDRVQDYADRASNKRSVDSDELQVPAYFQLELAAHIARIPAFHDVGDQRGDLVPVSRYDAARPLRPARRSASPGAPGPRGRRCRAMPMPSRPAL